MSAITSLHEISVGASIGSEHVKGAGSDSTIKEGWSISTIKPVEHRGLESFPPFASGLCHADFEDAPKINFIEEKQSEN